MPVEDLALATGSVALIYQLPQAFCEPGDEVVFAWRSFEAYPIAVAAAAATAVQVPVPPDGRHDLDAMAAAITDRTRIVLVCTPNNPTGPAVTQAELDAFLAKVPPHVLVVVDEAYVEFVRMDDPIDGLATYRAHDERRRHPHVLQGLRAGRLPGRVRRRADADRDRAAGGVAAVRHLRASPRPRPWPRSSAEPELLERVEALVAERARVVDRPAPRSAGTSPTPQGNFVWFELGERTADFAAAAEEAGIVVRPFAGEGARVSIGEPEANDRLIRVAGEWTG